MEPIDYASLSLTILGGAVIGRFAAVSIRATRKTILLYTLVGAVGSLLGTILAAYILFKAVPDQDPGMASYLVFTVAGPALTFLLFRVWTRSKPRRDQPL